MGLHLPNAGNGGSHIATALTRILLALVVVCFGCNRDTVGVGKGPVVVADSVQMREPVRSVPAFRGVDQNGKAFDSEQLRGKWWIGSFFFTSCETICPMINTVVTDLQKEWSSTVSFVSVTTDPDNDTQKVLAAYAKQYDARDGVWYLVRMPMDSMMVLAESGMGVMKPVTPAGHSTRLVLVDDKMQVRDYFDGTDSVQVARLETLLNSMKTSR